MNPGRLLAALTGILGFWLILIALDSVAEFITLRRAATWSAVRGEVTESANAQTHGISRRALGVRGEAYLLVVYRFAAPNGEFTGRSPVSIESGLQRGSSVEIKYNPLNPSESVPVASINDRKHGATVLAGIALPFAFLLWLLARYLWRQSAGKSKTIE